MTGGGESQQAAPGWYPDPSGTPNWRWWDGTRWTETTEPYLTRLAEVSDQAITLDEGSGLGVGENRMFAGEALVGRLLWGGLKNRLTGDATFITAEGACGADGRGLIDRKVHLLRADSGQEIGRFDYAGFSGKNGVLNLSDGRTLHWGAGRTWSSMNWGPDWGEWYLSSPNGDTVLSAFTHDREGYRVTISPEAREEPWLPLMVPLAFYLLVKWQDTQASRPRPSGF